MRFTRVIGAFLAVSIAIAPLVGCSSQTDVSTQKAEESKSQGDISGNLTKQVECAGVKLLIDPTWKDNSNEKTSLRLDASSACVIATHVYANGETSNLDSFKQIDGVFGSSLETEKEWSKDGISYAIASGKNDYGDLYSYLFGCDSKGIGFYVFFNMGSSAVTDANMSVRDELFDNTSFSPSEALDAIHAANSTDSTSNENEGSASPTLGESNALSMANSYLDTMPFSHDGLVKQLEYEGFSKDESTYAADNCGADWNEQAAQMAQRYIDTMSFSRSGLIEQLQHEGFTSEQAEYGVSSVGY